MRKVHLQSENAALSLGIPVSPGGSTGLWHSGTFNNTGIWERSVAQKRLVMVIDDSATIRKIVEVSLSREGLEVVSFPDGIEALQAVTSGKVDRIPDLIFLDIELPKMNGYEIARYLRSKPQWGKTVIVILSRHDGLIDRLKARLAGTQAYLTKPFTTQMIIELVNSSLKSADGICEWADKGTRKYSVGRWRLMKLWGSRSRDETEMSRSALGGNTPGDIAVVLGGEQLDFNLVYLGCQMAKGAGRKVHLVHVIEVPRALPLKAVLTQESERADMLLNSAMQIAERIGSDAIAEVVQAREAGPAIVDEARDHKCVLLLLGCIRSESWNSTNLGKTVSYVLANASCRVWLVQDLPH